VRGIPDIGIVDGMAFLIGPVLFPGGYQIEDIGPGSFRVLVFRNPKDGIGVIRRCRQYVLGCTAADKQDQNEYQVFILLHSCFHLTYSIFKITIFFLIFASMKKILTILAALCAVACSTKETRIYDFSALSNEGEEVNFSDYKGKVLLIVNTASKCGFTPQYDGLEALYKKYKDQGLVVIGFPCDQFGHQEPGTNEEIAEFCRVNHGVTFPLMDKIDVNGENAHPIFQWLYSQKPFEGFGEGETAQFMDQMLSRRDPEYASNPDIKWNFTKFLIDRKGRVVARFEPMVTPEDLDSAVASQL
jgi:glutathione peroxidase